MLICSSRLILVINLEKVMSTHPSSPKLYKAAVISSLEVGTDVNEKTLPLTDSAVIRYQGIMIRCGTNAKILGTIVEMRIARH